MTSMVARIALMVINILNILMLITAISSWIPQVRESRLGYYLQLLTEPIVAPFRQLLRKIPALRYFPLDLSFLAALLALNLLYNFLIRLL